MKLHQFFYISLFSSLISFYFTNSIIAQDTLGTKTKFSLAIDVGFSTIYSIDGYTLNDYSFNYRDKGGLSSRIDFVYYPINNWGYSFSYESNTYSYEVPLYSNSKYSNYKVIKSENIDFKSINLIFGLNYKYHLFKSLTVIPRMLLGWDFMKEGTSSILLKEDGSNNIREVNTIFNSSNPDFYISFRTDFRLNLSTHFGCLISIFTENYLREIKCYEYIKDNMNEDMTFEKFKYHHSALNASFGGFYNF